MKKFLKITGYTAGIILIAAYLSFLFVLPNVINLEKYKPEVQKLVKDNVGLTVDAENIKVITSPFLEAGVRAKNLTVKLPDDTVLFKTDKFRAKVFLPALALFHVYVSDISVDHPILNLEIEDSEQYKIARVYENIVNERRQDKMLHPEKYEKSEEQKSSFDFSKIKITVPALKLKNYSAIINDTKAEHKLILQGDKLKAGYFNGKKAKLQTKASIFSDDAENITADLNIDTYIPAFSPSEQEEEDLEEKFSVPFVNPVSTYRNYNLKSAISSKIKIRKDKKTDNFKANGFLNIENTSVSMAGLQLPPSYFKLKAKGTLAQIDTNIYVTENEFLDLNGKIDIGKKPFIDLIFKTTQVHFDNILNITKAYLDTIHIKNNISSMSAGGYLLANARLKTDFNSINSSGKIVVRNGNVNDKNEGLLFDKINANVFFDDNVISLKDTRTLINGKSLKIDGKIDANSVANFEISGDSIPIAGLYRAFAPKEVKDKYVLNSGLLTLNAKLSGEIKNIAILIQTGLENIGLYDVDRNFVLTDKLMKFSLANYNGEIRGILHNDGLNVIIPKHSSIVSVPKLLVNIDNNSILLNQTISKFNKKSLIQFSGEIKNYLHKYDAQLRLDGHVATSDIWIFLGDMAAPYFDSKGNIPIKMRLNAKGKKAKLTFQASADSNNYITPVHFEDLVGKQTILQVLAELNNSTLRILKSGIFVRPQAEFDSNLNRNISHSKQIIGIKAAISNLYQEPFVNILKVTVSHNLKGSIHILKKSEFVLNGKMYGAGKIKKFGVDGLFNVEDIKLPEIMTQIKKISVGLKAKNIHVIVNDINANNSHFQLWANSTWDLIQKCTFSNARIFSRYIDVNKILPVVDAVNKSLPANQTIPDIEKAIPLVIHSGDVRLRRIVMDKIVVNDTTGKISLNKNVLNVNDLKTYPMGGYVFGNAAINLVTTELHAIVKGNDFDIEKILHDVLDMKDALSGKMNFSADLKMKGTEQVEQMKSLSGFVDFNVKNGQLGPFGKFENFLMAENIRENAFFSSTIGSIITNIVTFDTSRFNQLYGHIGFNGDGIAKIAPIKSQGNVMSLYIAGDLGLIDNSAEMKVRGKLASAFSDKLGPLANINPINLIKHTPGLNIVMAKTFTLFCEAVSEEEMAAIPELGEGKSDENATKFQIRLKGDTRKPLKMIKSFKWLALNSDIESAQNFVDTIPTPAEGEENLSVEELIELRQEQAKQAEIEAKKPLNRIKNLIKRNNVKE